MFYLSKTACFGLIVFKESSGDDVCARSSFSLRRRSNEIASILRVKPFYLSKAKSPNSSSYFLFIFLRSIQEI